MADINIKIETDNRPDLSRYFNGLNTSIVKINKRCIAELQ